MILEEQLINDPAYIETLQREKCVLLSHEQKYGSDPHDHHFLELSYILKGEADHDLDGKIDRLRAGNYIIVDYGSRHSYRNPQDAPFTNIDCLFLPEVLDPALKGTRTLRAVLEHYLLHFQMHSPIQNPARMVFYDADGTVLELLEKIRLEQRIRAPGYGELIRCYLMEILLFTLRRMEGVDSAMESEELYARVGSYVAEHFREEALSLSSIARVMGYSLPYLSKKFKEASGIGFTRYLQRYRMMQACRYLSVGNMAISQVAERVGYRDIKSFASVFKREMGLSPRAFRKQM